MAVRDGQGGAEPGDRLAVEGPVGLARRTEELDQERTHTGCGIEGAARDALALGRTPLETRFATARSRRACRGKARSCTLNERLHQLHRAFGEAPSARAYVVAELLSHQPPARRVALLARIDLLECGQLARSCTLRAFVRGDLGAAQEVGANARMRSLDPSGRRKQGSVVAAHADAAPVEAVG